VRDNGPQWQRASGGGRLLRFGRLLLRRCGLFFFGGQLLLGCGRLLLRRCGLLLGRRSLGLGRR
jgi:hypothetical protein